MAERQGFEPWEPFRGSTVFETVPFDHSGIAPSVWCERAIIFQDFRRNSFLREDLNRSVSRKLVQSVHWQWREASVG